MTAVRAALVALTILVLAVAPMVVPGATRSSGTQAAYAAPADSPSLQNDNDNDNDNEGDNDNDNNDNDDHDGDNDNWDNGNEVDDGDDDRGAPPAAPMQLVRPSAAACSTPGQESVVTSDDGRVAVRVFGTMPRSIRLMVRLPIESGLTPAPPGQLVGGLLFQVIAADCGGGPIPVLPAEVNLGARYGDADVAGLSEPSFTIARLDTNTNQWRPVEKQAADPANNYDSATITEMGYYVVYQRP